MLHLIKLWSENSRVVATLKNDLSADPSGLITTKQEHWCGITTKLIISKICFSKMTFMKKDSYLIWVEFSINLVDLLLINSVRKFKILTQCEK